MYIASILCQLCICTFGDVQCDTNVNPKELTGPLNSVQPLDYDCYSFDSLKWGMNDSIACSAVAEAVHISFGETSCEKVAQMYYGECSYVWVS